MKLIDIDRQQYKQITIVIRNKFDNLLRENRVSEFKLEKRTGQPKGEWQNEERSKWIVIDFNILISFTRLMYEGMETFEVSLVSMSLN